MSGSGGVICPIFGETQHEEGDTLPQGGERRVVKAGSCEQLLQTENVLLTFFVQPPKEDAGVVAL
jgi:hypothetical protein